MTVVNPKSISGINSITTGSGSDDILTIHTNNGTERLRVDSTGATKIVTGIVTTLTATSSAKVGSGITLSPDGDISATGITTISYTGTSEYGLDVQNPTSGGSGARIRAGDSDSQYSLLVENGAGTNLFEVLAGGGGARLRSGDLSILDKIAHYGDGNTFIRFPAADTVTVETGGSERFRIDSSGRVIMGDTDTGNAFSGGDSLVIGNTSARSGITLVSSTSNDGGLYFSDGTSSGNAYIQGQIVYNHSNGSLSLYTAASERARIDSSGRLLLSNTDGASYADSSVDDLIIGSAANGKNDGITILSGTGQNGTLAFADSGGSTQGLVGYVHNGDYLRLHAGNTLKVRIDTDGIKFNSDTAAANALNDYEEGTWTPRWHGQGNNVTISTSVNTGTYTKVGDLINVKLYSVFSARNGANGVLAMDGLPFSNQGNYTTTNIGYWHNMSNLNAVFGSLVGYIGDGSQEVVFNAITSTGLESSDVNKTTNSSSIMLNFTYRIWTS